MVASAETGHPMRLMSLRQIRYPILSPAVLGSTQPRDSKSNLLSSIALAKFSGNRTRAWVSLLASLTFLGGSIDMVRESLKENHGIHPSTMLWVAGSLFALADSLLAFRPHKKEKQDKLDQGNKN